MLRVKRFGPSARSNREAHISVVHDCFDCLSDAVRHPAAVRPSRVRHTVLAFAATLAVVTYVDRVCISSAKSNIAADLQLSDTQMGWVLSIFALGYALFQVPSGIMADRYGPRIILSAVVTFWSLFTALTAAAQGFISMLACRFLFGAGEAGAFPGCARAVYSAATRRAISSTSFAS